jgi:endonuclease G
MKKFIYAALLLVTSCMGPAHANPIDDKCPQLTYKHAPVVAADQFICHTEYAVALSYKTRNPAYTTEYLAADHTGAVARSNDFKPDPQVPAQYAVKPHEYAGQICHGERCDKGHMTPDQDFSACEPCVHESFYMSNMVPQNARNNEIIWKHMEISIRNYVAAHGPVYVITGPVYGNNPDHIGNGIAVPDQLFKVVISVATGVSVAFLMPNEDKPISALPSFIVPLALVEGLAGVSFDESLDKHAVGALKVLQ